MLASKLNIGRQTLSAYERGVTLPDVLALIEIADYFGVSLDELTGRSELIIPDEKNKRKSPEYKAFRSMRKMGLEPTRHECHKILSLARLPVPTLPHSILAVVFTARC